jgi:ATP-dependent HslUV protease, peptidase subunit HslV
VSTIVVVRKAGFAAIAADTCTSFGDLKMLGGYEVGLSKIMEHDGSYLALAGSPTHQLVLESVFRRRGRGARYAFGDKLAIFESLVRLHGLMKEDYFLSSANEEQSDPYESIRFEMLIANRSGIFGAYALREVSEYAKFWALGSGSDYALGAMYAAYDRLETAAEIAELGVRAGAEFDVASALPLAVHTVRLDSDG